LAHIQYAQYSKEACDMFQSVNNANELLQQQKEPSCRYMLKIDSDPDCVVLTSDMFLIVASKRRGHLLVFNLRFIAYLGGQAHFLIFFYIMGRRQADALDACMCVQ